MDEIVGRSAQVLKSIIIVPGGFIEYLKGEDREVKVPDPPLFGRLVVGET
ncbi:MAG: hypothetical protein ACYDA9_12860 [Terriglobia bacterium]